MNIFIRNCFLVVLFTLVLEIIEMGEAYKPGRPYKYYPRRPWNRPRQYTGRKSSKFYHSKRTPPEDYYDHRPSYYRPAFGNEDFEDIQEAQPYSIVIQLAKDKHAANSYAKRKRTYERDSIPLYTSESDYIDDEEDSDSKLYNINDKKVQIKMVKGENPQLQIKISRSDDEKDIEIVDKSNITVADQTLLPKAQSNLTSLSQTTGSWMATPSVESIH